MYVFFNMTLCKRCHMKNVAYTLIECAVPPGNISPAHLTQTVNYNAVCVAVKYEQHGLVIMLEFVGVSPRGMIPSLTTTAQ